MPVFIMRRQRTGIYSEFYSVDCVVLRRQSCFRSLTLLWSDTRLSCRSPLKRGTLIKLPWPSKATLTFKIIPILSVLGWVAVLISCAPALMVVTAPGNTSPWKGKYALSYNPPDKKNAQTIPITIAVVNPGYKGEGLSESMLATRIYDKVGRGFSSSMGNDLDKVLITKGLTTMGPYASREEITYDEKKGAALTLAPQIFIETTIKYDGELQKIAYGPDGNAVKDSKLWEFVNKMMLAYNKGGANSPQVKKVAQDWAVIVTSGIPKNEVGPIIKEWTDIFASGANMSLIEEPAADMQAGGAPPVAAPSLGRQKGMMASRTGGGARGKATKDASFGLARFERKFTMTTSGWMYFTMHEPMTGEKMWVKKLELDPVEIQGTEAYSSTARIVMMNDGCGGVMEVPQGLEPGPYIVYDGKADAMATTLQKMYPIIMGKFAAYLDPEELEALNQKGADIRTRKVYAR